MNLGLTSVTFRSKTVEEIIALAKSSGLNCIEWGGDVHAPIDDINKAIEVKNLCEEANIAISSYGSYYRGADKHSFLQVLKIADALKAPIIRIWAGEKFEYEESEYAVVVENIKAAAQSASEHGIKLALEYHRNTLTQTKESALKLIKDVNHSNLYTYWQPNPDISLDEQLSEIKLLKDYIITYHVFNWEKGNVRLPLSEGHETWVKYLDEINPIEPNLILEFVKDESVEIFMSDVVSLKGIAQNKELKQAVFMNNGDKIFDIYDEANLERIRENFAISDIVVSHKDLDANRELLLNTEYIFSTWGMCQLSEDEIKTYLPKLKAVFYGAGTVQGFARPFLNCGVKIFSAWAANAVPVAEYTVAQIVLSGKGFFTCVDRYRKDSREAGRAFTNAQPGNYNIKVGLIGAGMIGKLVMDLLKNYEYEVLVYDPYVSDEVLAEHGAKRASLEKIFSDCQIVSNHLPNIPTTVGMLKYEHFSSMIDNATFINTGRGAQIIEEDMIKALVEKPNLTALLDVTFPEPPLPESPLNTLPNVFLTPHIAGSMNNEVVRMGKYIINEAECLIANLPCKYEIKEHMLELIG